MSLASSAISRLPSRKVRLVAGDLRGHDGADLDDAVALRRLADGGGAQQLRQLTDARLDLALLVLGGVVAAVLLEVALLASRLDLLGDVDARGTAPARRARRRAGRRPPGSARWWRCRTWCSLQTIETGTRPVSAGCCVRDSLGQPATVDQAAVGGFAWCAESADDRLRVVCSRRRQRRRPSSRRPRSFSLERPARRTTPRLRRAAVTCAAHLDRRRSMSASIAEVLRLERRRRRRTAPTHTHPGHRPRRRPPTPATIATTRSARAASGRAPVPRVEAVSLSSSARPAGRLPWSPGYSVSGRGDECCSSSGACDPAPRLRPPFDANLVTPGVVGLRRSPSGSSWSTILLLIDMVRRTAPGQLPGRDRASGSSRRGRRAADATERDDPEAA